jgi:hypothetical protein
VSTCPYRASHPPAGILALNQLPWRAWRRSRCASEAATRAAVDTPASHAGHPLPRQARLGQTTNRSRTHGDTSNPVRSDVGCSAAPTALQDPPRCGQRGCRGRGHGTRVGRTPGPHRTLGYRTRGHRTPGPHRTLDTGRPHSGQRTRTGRRTAWPASGHPRPPRRRRPPPGYQPSLGLQRLRRSATHGGSAVTTPAGAALTAAATEQLLSTARHEAAPRRTALVCWSWRVRGEGNGTTERRGCTGSGL